MARQKLHPVRVRIREVPYQVLTQNLLGQDQMEQRSGFGPGRPEIHPDSRTDVSPEEAKLDWELGQLIQLMDADYVRLRNAGAVIDEDEAMSLKYGEEVEVLDINEASVDDLASWIREEKPNANEVVQKSGGDPELAEKLLQAETIAKDGDPRKAVLDGLGTVISRG